MTDDARGKVRESIEATLERFNLPKAKIELVRDHDGDAAGVTYVKETTILGRHAPDAVVLFVGMLSTGDSASLYLPPSEARKLAAYLLNASDSVDRPEV